MKRLDERAGEKKEVMHIHDSRMTCEECGDTGHSESSCPELQKDVNYLNNNSNYYRPQQNQGWNLQHRPNYSGNYSGNYQGNNSFNQLPLRELVLNQRKLMDSLSKKLASNDKTLEIINNRMDNFSTAIKNQLSFNKMLESQLQQLANIVPANQGKILGQSEDLETANLVDIFNAGSYWSDPISK
jgi:hypothetical protein